MRKKETDYAELLQKRKYDPNKEPPAEQVLFIIESKNIGAVQNFVTITGMQKSGKTTFLSAMVAAALTNNEQLGMRLRLPELKRRVSYWDTEQGDYDFFKTMDKIRAFCGTDKVPQNLDAYNLREDEPQDIMWMIKKYLELHKDCGIIVIDGILDLIESFNDEAESKRLVNTLKKITKESGVLAILTLHKGKTTNNTLGHLGSMADRAAQSVLFVEKNKERNTFILKADYLRSADDFTPIEIYFNNGAHRWEQTDYNPDADKPANKKRQTKPNEIDREAHRNNVYKIFTFSDPQKYSELVQNINELYAVGTNWAKDCVRHLMHEGLIYKTSDGYTNKQQAKLYIQ